MDYKIDQLTYNNNTYKFIDNTTTIGTGLSKSVNNAGPVLNHSNSVAAKTTQALYPITFDTQGHITGAGSAQTIPDVSNKIDTAGSGLSKSGTTLNHSNSITAQTTRALYPIKIDAQGHISEYGSAVTIPTVPSAGTSATNIGATSSGGSATTWSKSDHVHKLNITLNNQNYTPDSNGVINLGTISGGGGGISSESDPVFTASSAATIFIATYGTTTYSEVQTAYNNGKTLFAVKDNAVYSFKYLSSNEYSFVGLSGLSSGTRLGISSTGWATYSLSFVNTERTINNKALSSNITLNASDVGALPSNTTYVSSVNNQTGAVTVSVPTSGNSVTAIGTAAAGSATTWSRSDHVHNITKAVIDSTLQTTNGTTKFYREDGTWAVPAGGSGSVIPSVIIERW